MAFKALLFSVVVLAIANQITAEQGFQFPFQLPNFSGFGQSDSGSGSSGFLALFPFQLPNFLNSQSSSSTTEASRSKRSAEAEEEDHQTRLFFTAFPTISSCNYTTQAGVSCPSCTQALRCLPNNIGILTRCRGLFRHCNNGRCSLFQSSECSSTTAATTEPTAATAG